MSDLARSFAKTKLSALPPETPLTEEERTEREDDSSSASSMSSVGTIRPSSSHKPVAAVPWSDFFEQELWLEHETPAERAKYHVYYTPSQGQKSPFLVLQHGAGSCGLSFALFAKEFRRIMPEVGLLCLEAREHGSVVYDANTGNVKSDMSINTLSNDMATTLDLVRQKSGWTQLPHMLLVGHSLGGAIVTNTAKLGLLGNRVLGYVVLDVVEGSAVEALGFMQSYLATRPSVFGTLTDAIDWHIKSRTLRNIESAKVSVPGLLLQTQTGKWIWRTDLSKTESYWQNWFGGMSSKFLTGRGAKLLMLAGTDRLDKELMIGQMQGKFQLQVLPMAGHFIQEDLPEETAKIIAEFLRRNDNSALILPPKVSDLLAQGKKV